MSGICDMCDRAICEGRMECGILPIVHDGCDTNFYRLFGTPERAARTLTYSTPICIDCAIRDGCEKKTCIIDKYDTMLEWLRGDAE